MKDLVGQKFNRYTVIAFSGTQSRAYFWKCQCECGTVKVINQSALTRGTTKSCGCLNREMSVDRAKTNFTKHGLKKHPLYRTRTHMITRCYNLQTHNYKYYGGRGIAVCDEWLDKEQGFLNFYNWSIENGWEKGLTIDRIDVNGNYEPSNCRWITMAEQQRNKRNVAKKHAQ